MKLSFLLFISLFWSSVLFGQNFNQKYFAKTDWFSNNKDSAFYKADTVKFIKHSNYGPEWASKEFAEHEMKYLGHGDFVEISFYKRQKMNLCEIHLNYQALQTADWWKWVLDKKNGSFTIYYNKKVVSSFRPLSEKQIKIDSKFANHKKELITTELTLVRVR